MAQHDALLKPLTIKNVTFRNRIMSTSHAPSYGEGGMPKERYQLYHEEKAKGGIGLTAFGGSSSVSPDSPAAMWNQLNLGTDEIVPHLQEFAERVHRHGAKIICQITHMGRRNRWDTENWLPLISSSPVREPAHRSFPKEAEDWDIRRVIADYAAAAGRCRDGGLDGCEVLMDTHLPGQFWSPSVNRRTDGYGGDLKNRMRFTLELLTAVRERVGDDYIIGIRFSGDEMMKAGLTHEEVMEIVQAHVEAGLVDYLNVNCGNVYTERNLARFIPGMNYPVAPYLYLPSAVRRAFDIPVFHAGRITDLVTAARAVEEGHVDMVAMTRAHMADPHIVNKLRDGRIDDIRQCVGAGYCIDRIYFGGDALCIQNPATGRERILPHIVPRGEGGKRVVVVGGGPGGMEAARVSAERGHSVALLEKEDRLGGQINIAAKADWREGLNGITRWLSGQVERLGVDVRLGVEADKAAVIGLEPDIVVVATGGRPNLGEVKAAKGQVVSTWDVLTGRVEPAENVLIFDDQGDNQAPSCAAFMARRGSLVEIVTPERRLLEEVGGTNFPVHLQKLYEQKVVITPDMRLTEVYAEGNRLVAVLMNEYTDAEEEREVDQVVVEHGTLPVDDLYFALKPESSNLGAVELRDLVAGRPQTLAYNPSGRFQLFRVGDAAASRNIHAALYDSLRLCMTF